MRDRADAVTDSTPATAATPRLYPVTLDLACPVHGLLQRMTVTSLAAQVQWTKQYADQHMAAVNCYLSIETLVPTDA